MGKPRYEVQRNIFLSSRHRGGKDFMGREVGGRRVRLRYEKVVALNLSSEACCRMKEIGRKK